MTFKIFSIKVSVSFLFMAMLSLILLTDKTGYAPLMLLAAIIHEAGHLLAMGACKCTPTEVKLIPGSVQICSPPSSIKHEIFILVCGPLINLITFFAVFLFCRLTENTSLLAFALINLLYFGFNILPLCGLDGGSVCFAYLSRIYGKDVAEKSLNIITVLSAVAVLCIFIASVIKGNVNYSVCVLFCYLILSVFLKF